MKNYFFLFLLLPFMLTAQSETIDKAYYNHLGKAYLSEQATTLGLTKEDVTDLIISDFYRNNNNGWIQLIYNQAHKDIPVNQALINLTIKTDGTIHHVGHRFVTDLKNKIDSDILLLSMTDAMTAATNHLGLAHKSRTEFTKLSKEDRLQKRQQHYTSDLCDGPIIVEPKYVRTTKGYYRLSYEVYLAERNNADSWLIYVDAITGVVLSKSNQTVYCKHHHHSDQNNHLCRKSNRQKYAHPKTSHQSQQCAITVAGDGAKYRVLALPTENPTHGPFTMVEDPSIELASPFGWHDKDGAVGAEFTITRGNNVWAFEDTEGSDISRGNEPDGGFDLVFDYAFDPNSPLDRNLAADVTNMFYVCNMMHDRTHLIGFDSAAGAYQENTYGTGGEGDDLIFAQSQDGSGLNNANFRLSPDGVPGKIQMYRWVISKVFRVLGVSLLAGDYVTNQGNWNNTPDYQQLDIQSELAIALDGSMDNLLATHACDEVITDVEGKIALIQRGTCEFGDKALNAERAGAVAVIICNVPFVDGNGEDAMGMQAGELGDQVTIPVLSMGYTNCQNFIQKLSTEPIQAELKVIDGGPGEVSSGFDNTIIAHEYGHGISTRLIGGPSNISCLSNDEQMGEGISDFFALIMTVEAGDRGTDRRGMGNYVEGLEAVADGYRRYPYSTDLTICPLTVEDIKGTSNPSDSSNGIHAVGEVWAATLWDIYWAFSERDGWTEDWTDNTKGNVKAMKLIIDGMKMAPCNPSFQDMRDAIFAADDSKNTCLLWEIFARRGMGYLSAGNDPWDRDDNIVNFEPLPTCIKSLKIEKEITSLVTPGEQLPVIITVHNHLEETATGVTVTDILDRGLSIVPASLDFPFTQTGDTISIELGNMQAQASQTITYLLDTDPDLASITKEYNAIETADEQQAWQSEPTGSIGDNSWEVSPLDAYSGLYSWMTGEIDGISDQRLEYRTLTLRGDNPTVRFWHKINCTPIKNGGFVEYSTDGTSWNPVSDRFVTDGYTGSISYSNLGLAGLEGFSGYNNAIFQDAYLDFSDLRGEAIDLRFRFATYDHQPFSTIEFSPEAGWHIDDLELMDLEMYTVSSAVSATNADTSYTDPQIIIIDSNRETDRTGSKLTEAAKLAFSISPNPARTFVDIKWHASEQKDVSIELLSSTGTRLLHTEITAGSSIRAARLDLTSIPAGFYLLRMSNGKESSTEKFVIH